MARSVSTQWTKPNHMVKKKGVNETTCETQNKNTLDIILINARSIINKSDELISLLELYDPFLLFITETWLKNDIPLDSIFTSDYQIFRKDRDSRGGGVLIAAKSDKFQIISIDSTAEIIGCKCKLDANLWYFVCAYRTFNYDLFFLRPQRVCFYYWPWP